MAPSTSTTSLVSVVAVLLLLLPTSSVSDEILAACKTVGGGSTYVGVQFCEDALRPVAASGTMDYQLFAGLVVGLLADNATSTEATIDRLLRGGVGGVKLNAEDDAAVSRCLLSCRSLYRAIVHGGPACTAAVKAGKFAEATATLEKAAAAAKECEDGFGKNNASSPLSVEDDDAFQLANLGVGLLRFA